MTEKIYGQKIKSISTTNTKYMDNYLSALLDDGRLMRVHISTILSMVNEFRFDVVHKRVYDHLENPVLKG